ncbi:Outer membrane protein beta-barrel domain-containing protein [Fibrobacter sp. UWT2]|uniref:outer membrane beta-barrel protein n=1 Tax=Fibrobacter sp. UWT2 TaxID=1896224 RepID=UPI00091673EA|nr:outer membrane beta-barrel protein [Fibrobacter sp. UWT2]SHK50300.1 Outer membrane protein beta-barrel domain-containing protein [Fibrobacter sp. UWT2]
MNRKITGILSVLALSAFTFAQEPAAATAAPAAAPAEEAAPVAVRGADAAAPAATEQAAPAAAEAPAAAVAEAPAAAEPVAEPAVVVAPKAVRGADNKDVGPSSEAAQRFRDARNTVYYETVYTREDGVPVRTVYVAEREGKDTVTMDELRGLYPMSFKIGAHASVGAYQLAGSDWDSDQYNGMNWKAGIMSIIPLNAYTMGIKLGVLFEQSRASESYYVNEVPTNFKFSQKKIDIPVLFTFKAATSRIFFDLGAEMSIPLYDKLRVSYTDSNDKKHSSRTDMMDDYRNNLDWAFVFGFSVMANKYISLDISANLGMSDLYDGHMKNLNLNLDASSFNVGISVYPF